MTIIIHRLPSRTLLSFSFSLSLSHSFFYTRLILLRLSGYLQKNFIRICRTQLLCGQSFSLEFLCPVAGYLGKKQCNASHIKEACPRSPMRELVLYVKKK